MIDLTKAQNIDVILHIGLHKTATTYIQNKFAAHRYDLVREGIVYPRAGEPDRPVFATRGGAQSGHALLTRAEDPALEAIQGIAKECPESTRCIVLSSENFAIWTRPFTAAEYLARFNMFRSVKVVLVVRRQDSWLESYYKQIVDGFRDYETRSFGEFLSDEGWKLIDFYSRFSEWRTAAGADNFHVLSFDDCKDADEIGANILKLAGASDELIDAITSADAERYDSVRAIDTLALRILNAYQLNDRDERIELARNLVAASPASKFPLMTADMRDAIEEFCKPINERIVAEWARTPMPNFLFAKPPKAEAVDPVDPALVADYVGYAISVCEGARSSLKKRVNERAAPANGKRAPQPTGGAQAVTAAAPPSQPPVQISRKTRGGVGDLVSRLRARIGSQGKTGGSGSGDLSAEQRQWADTVRPLFDERFYLSAHPEVAAAGTDPVAHYIKDGFKQGFDPTPWFSERGYRRVNRDVAKSNYPALVHYILYGRKEGRPVMSVVQSNAAARTTDGKRTADS